MAQHKFSLKYPDGRTRHIDAATRDSFLVSQSIKETAPGRYVWIEQHVYHSLQDLGRLALAEETSGPVRRYLIGPLKFMYRGRVRFEYEQSVEGMQLEMVKG